MEQYRNEIGGRLSLGVKCAACVSALSVLAAVGVGAGDRGAAETPTHAVARQDGGSGYDEQTVADDRRVVSVAPMSAP